MQKNDLLSCQRRRKRDQQFIEERMSQYKALDVYVIKQDHIQKTSRNRDRMKYDVKRERIIGKND